jgi:N-acetylglutamate synthase-like GNAT family acetyltransferase
MILRDMTIADIPAGLRLCRACGWNQLESDWRIFLKQSPKGCRVVEQHGQVVGTVATLCFQNRFAWISMMLVDPNTRGQGIGKRLFSEALEVLRDVPCIRLDATSAGRELYKNFGFLDEYTIYRTKTNITEKPQPGTTRRMTATDLPEVLAKDREIFGADRAFLLKTLFQEAPEYAWIVPGLGYSFGRRGANCGQLGPIVAEDQSTARQLIAAQTGRSFYIDTPHQPPTYERSFIRMHRGEKQFSERVDRQYAITGPEFG